MSAMYEAVLDAESEVRPHEFVIGGIAPCQIIRGYYVGESDRCHTHGWSGHRISHGGDFARPPRMSGDPRVSSADICPVARIVAWKARRYLHAVAALEQSA